MIPKPFQPEFFPARADIEPGVNYIGLPLHGWVPLDEATSDSKYLDGIVETGPLMEIIPGAELLERIDAAASSKSAVKLALEAIAHDFEESDVVGVLVNTVSVPRRVEVTVRYADGCLATYRQNQHDEAAESWSKVCGYDINRERY